MFLTIAIAGHINQLKIGCYFYGYICGLPMSIIRQGSLFDIQDLYELEPTHRFDAIFSTLNINPILMVVSKKPLYGAPTPGLASFGLKVANNDELASLEKKWSSLAYQQRGFPKGKD